MVEALTTLYLCGGEAGHAAAAPDFVRAAGGRDGRVALLLQGGPSTPRHLPTYVDPWRAAGLGGFTIVAGDGNGRLDVGAALTILNLATAIYIGGGDTALYRQMFAEGEVGELIRQRCRDGLPYGGLSAGALIAADCCPVDDPTAAPGQPPIIMKGLGLYSGMLCAPHYQDEKWPARLRAALQATQIPLGYGLPDAAAIVIAPDGTVKTIGEGVVVVANSAVG